MSTAPDTDTRGTGADRSSTLDRRRAKAQQARTAAEAGQAKVAELEGRLRANADQNEQHETALQRALQEASRLKKDLKALAKERAKLRTTRRKARTTAEKRQRKARVAEGKYDQSVLAEMVRREKEADAARSRPATAPADEPTDELADHPTDEPTSDGATAHDTDEPAGSRSSDGDTVAATSDDSESTPEQPAKDH